MIGEQLASFFAERGLTHCFGVVGAGNIRIFDAIHKLGKTQIISCHHEQACAQASIAYYRVSGRIAPVLVTCGGGASNVVTGVVSAWMDSIPLFVVAGQESRRNENLRAYGVQGFCLTNMVKNQTNVSKLIEGNYPGFSLDLADWFRATGQRQMFDSGDGHGVYRNSIRGGPVVLEIPMDLQ